MKKTEKNTTKPVTKTDMVLKHLKKKKSITSWQAIENYGATRLSAIIFNLKKNYNINTKKVAFTDRLGNKSTFTKYIYGGPKTND